MIYAHQLFNKEPYTGSHTCYAREGRTDACKDRGLLGAIASTVMSVFARAVCVPWVHFCLSFLAQCTAIHTVTVLSLISSWLSLSWLGLFSLCTVTVRLSVGLAQHCRVSISPRPHQTACHPTKPGATHCGQFSPGALALPFLECHRSVVTCCRTFRSGFFHLTNHSSASFQLLHVSAVGAVPC